MIRRLAKSLGPAHADLAVITLNTIVLLAVANLGFGVAYRVKDSGASQVGRTAAPPESELLPGGHFHANGTPVDNGKRIRGWLRGFNYHAYENIMPPADVSRILDEQYEMEQLGIRYEPWVQYGNQFYHGEFIQYGRDRLGVSRRRTINPDPTGRKVIRIFVFGGSTTFGTCVADQHTWPSFLSRSLNDLAAESRSNLVVEVSNYGRQGYGPLQELVLFLDLLRLGHRPDFAIFMHGMNWGTAEDVPAYTYDLQRVMARAQEGGALGDTSTLPLIRLAKSVMARFQSKPTASPNKPRPRLGEDMLVERFRQSRELAKLIAGLYDVKTLHFLQPDGKFNYPLELYNFDPRLIIEERPRRERVFNALRADGGYIDLTGLFAQWGSKRLALIDIGHYSPNFSRFLAERVAREIPLDSLAGEKKPDRFTATGKPRS